MKSGHNARSKKPVGRASAPRMSDRDMKTWATIDHLKKMRRELDLNIRALESTLPEHDPTERQKMVLINPKTGKREYI